VPEPATLIIAFFAVLTAAAVQGASAFGFALVAVPLLMLVMPASEAVATSLMLGSLLNLLMIRDERAQIAWRELLPLLPATAAGTLAGAALLTRLDGAGFRIMLAAAFLGVSLMMLSGRSLPVRPGRAFGWTAGLLSGALNGATSMGGPPVVLYLTGRRLPKSSLRGTLATFFILGNLAALAAFLAGGLISAPVASRALLLALAVIPGYFAGRFLTNRLDSDGFRKAVLLTMAATALVEIGLAAFR
jgi:hypothetical protein